MAGATIEQAGGARSPEEIALSEERYRIAMQSLGSVIYEWKVETGRVEWFGPTEAVIGTGKGDAPRTISEWEEAIHPRDRQRVKAARARCLDTGEPFREVYEMAFGDGAHVHWRDAGARFPLRPGIAPKVVGSVREVGAQVKVENDLHESEERFRKVFDSATIGKALTLPDGRLGRVNAAFAAMLGYSRDEMEALTFPRVTHPDDVALSKECVRCLLAGERDTYRMEKRYLHKDGHIVWTDVSTILLRDQDGRPQHFITHVWDITDYKRAFEELELLRKDLERQVVERSARLVEAQETALRKAEEILDVSAPVIQVWEGIVAVPFVGSLDSERASKITERLLDAIVATGSEVVLLDITGVPIVDTAIAHHLIETTQAVKLLGARVILTGIRPSIAQTFVHLGVDMSAFITRSTLSAGLAYALDALGLVVERGVKG